MSRKARRRRPVARIRMGEIWREAWRNVSTGATRGLVGIGVFVVVIGAIGWFQASSVVDVARQAQSFREAGAAIQVIALTDRIDGAQCDALSSYPGIAAAGALRQVEDLRLAASPSAALPTFEATPGMADVLRQKPTTGAVTSGGVWLSSDLADVLGVNAERTVVAVVSGASISASGVFAYPSDGRLPTLAYTLVSPVPAQGAFDACWVEVWPEAASTVDLLSLPALPGAPGADPEQPRAQQLNSTLGTQFGARARLSRVPMWPITLGAVLLAAGLGIVLARMRRLELASALHAGLGPTALVLQVAFETILWLAVSVALLLPAEWVIAAYGNPDPTMPAFYPAARTTVLAAAAVFVAAILQTALTREKHLFRYFKNR